MPIVGGGYIRDYKFSQAWGVNPSAASGVVVFDSIGGVFTIEVGDYLVFSFDVIASTYGVVTDRKKLTSFSEGEAFEFTLADNRIRLQWQTVFGAWNIEDNAPSKRLNRPSVAGIGGDSSSGGDDDVDMNSGIGTPGSPAGPGLLSGPGGPGVRRRYKHLLPQHWESGIWTWSDEPLTARDILNSAFNNAWGDYGFSRSYHSALTKYRPIGVDHSGGVKLANLVSELNSKAGLDIRIDGARSLIWGRKGDGLLPLPDSTSDSINHGESMTSADTKIRVVGDRNRIQAINVELEPDWKPAWESMISETEWLREVASAFSMPSETKSDMAKIAARAREVTVGQYAAKKDDSTYLDDRPFGAVCRNNIPAWVYLNEIVFRSYRIPPYFELYGVPLSSLEMADTLLCDTELAGDGVSGEQQYRQGSGYFYPGVRAQAIHRGQPLDLADLRDIRTHIANSGSDYRTLWTEAGDFEVDAENFSIRFRSPVFIEGSAETGSGLFLRENRGEGGGNDISAEVSETSDFLDIVVPNPMFSVEAADVKASFCFVLGRFHKDYGRGPRRGFVAESALAIHALDAGSGSPPSSGTGSLTGNPLRLPSSATLQEVLYEDGSSALDIADDIGDVVLEAATIQAAGGFTRNGVAGSSLSTTIDRIDVNIEFGGVTEVITYTKARPSGVALAENTLQRIQRTGDLFPGMEQVRKEAKEYRMLANLFKGERITKSKGAPTSLSDSLSRPVGSENASTTWVFDKNNQAPRESGWKSGDVLWLDESGYPSKTGRKFGGVLVSAPASSGGEGSKYLPVVTEGVVPMRVTKGIRALASVRGAPGLPTGGASGDVHLGVLAHGEDVPDIEDDMLAMVRIGGAGPGYEGRWVPYITGTEQKELSVSPGTVTYLRIAEEDPLQEDDEYPVCEQEHPVYPSVEIGEGEYAKINEDPPPTFDITEKTSGSLWLITQRLKCPSSSFMPGGDDTPTERLVLKNRNEKPKREKGEFHLLLAEFDLETDEASGAKKIKDLDHRRKSDVTVAFKCADDEDSFDSAGSIDDDGPFDSSDFGSSDETDDPDSGSEDLDCPWGMKAWWANKKGCYVEGRSVVATWGVVITLHKLKSKCQNWKARITFLGGQAIPYGGGQTVEGTSLVVPLNGLVNQIPANFRFYYPPDCVQTELQVQIYSDPDDGSPPNECCGKTFTKKAEEFWPRYCRKSCTSSPPPPPEEE